MSAARGGTCINGHPMPDGGRCRQCERNHQAHRRGCSYCGALYHKIHQCPELMLGEESPNDWRQRMGQVRWSPWMVRNWWSVGQEYRDYQPAVMI